jgi:hypothetical protein
LDARQQHEKNIGFIHFLDQHTLVTICYGGVIVFWDLIFGNVLGRVDISGTPTSISFAYNNRFMFVGCKSNHFVTLVDTNKMKILNVDYIDNKKDASIMLHMFSSHKLIVGGENNELNVYSLLYKEYELEQMLAQKQFAELNVNIVKNPLFLASHIYDKYTKAWSFAYKKIYEFKQEKKIHQAKVLSSLFSDIPGKGYLIREIYDKPIIFGKFIDLYSKLSCMHIYKLVSKHKELQHTVEYEKLENKFEDLVKRAIVLLLKIKNGDTKRIRKHFAVFDNVESKSQVIHRFIRAEDEILMFQRLLVSKNFKRCFSLADGSPIVKLTNGYIKIIEYSHYLKKKCYIELSNFKFTDFKRTLDTFSSFKNYSDEIDKISDEVSYFIQLQSEFANKNLSNMLKLTTKYPVLNKAKIIKSFRSKWRSDYAISKSYAKNRNMIQVLKSMEFYILQNVHIEKVAILVCRCYIEQLINFTEILINKDNISTIENALIKLVDIFGKTRLISYYIECINRKHNIKISVKYSEPNFTNWRDIELPNVIYSIS